MFDSGKGGCLYQDCNANWLRCYTLSDEPNLPGPHHNRLNFALHDADPVAAGRQALSFIDTAAFSATGTAQVRYAASGADLLVQVDLDGNGTSDMEIVLAGAGGQVLTGSDYML